MRTLPRWCGWRGSKRPLDPRDGSAARVDDPRTFGTFEDALTFYRKHEAEPDAGAGFVFTRGDNLVFVDLDKCLRGGTPRPWAQALLKVLSESTYCEVSPSGLGVHAFYVGELPRAEGTTGARAEVGGGGGAVEAYAERRFSTVTGRRYGRAPLGAASPPWPAALRDKLSRASPGGGDDRPAEAGGAPESPNRRLEAWEAMQAIDPDVPNDDWVRVGMALKAAFGDLGLPLWVKWSSRGKKFKAGEPEQRWASFRRERGVGLGTLFHMAEAGGWRPAGRDAEPAAFEPARGEFWTVPASEVAEERLEWVVRDLGLVRGYASLVAGDPGRGKSLLTLDVAARLSSGRGLPWEREARPPCRVAYLNAEDGQGDTILPRLRAAGADLSRVELLDLAGGSRVPQLPDDVEELGGLLDLVGGVELVVVDPINAFLGSEVDAHKAHDVRQALQPLANLLRRTRRAVCLVAHLNKNEAVSALYRVSGSADQIAFVRTALLVGADPDAEDESARVVAPLKWNLGPPPPARGFRLVDSGGDVGRVEWGDESAAGAEDLVRRPESSRGKVEEASAWLRSRLAAGPAPSRELEPEARKAGFSRSTLNRAARQLGLRRERDELAGGWRWPKVESFEEVAAK